MANWTRDDSRSRADEVLEDMGIIGDLEEYRDFNYNPQRSSAPRGLLAGCCVMSLMLLPITLLTALWRKAVR